MSTLPEMSNLQQQVRFLSEGPFMRSLMSCLQGKLKREDILKIADIHFARDVKSTKASKNISEGYWAKTVSGSL